MTTFVKVPFAQSGDKTDPPITDPAGGVNWTQGYPQAYSKDPATDPAAKRIEREGFNGVLNKLSTAINEIQVKGVATYITASDNGGSAFAYSKGSVVSLSGNIYRSTVDNNTTTPPGATWSLVPEYIQPLDATLSALAVLVGAANKLPYFNGADTAALTDLTQVGRDILGKSDIAAVLTYLGLKNAAGYDVQSNQYDGTSGRVLQVGAFGLGSIAPTAVSDANTINANGFYKLGGGALNTPIVSIGAELIHCQYDQNSGQQIAWRPGVDSSPIYQRGKVNGVWGAWAKVYDERNKPTAAELGLGTASSRNVGTGSNQVPDMSSFTSGSGVNGWWKKGPDGVIEQYGIIPGMTSTGITSAFPIAFPNEMRALTFGITGNSGANNYPVVTISLTPATGTKLTHFTATGYNTGISGITTLANVIFYYHAIGF